MANAELVGPILNEIGQHLWNLISLQFIDPWYIYIADAVGVTALLAVVVFFFPFTWIRAAAGLFVVGEGVWLWGYRKAQKDAEAKAKKKKPTPPASKPRQWEW